MATDVGKAIDAALNIPIHPDFIILVREHPDHPGYLYFDVGEDVRQEFYEMYRSWMSRFLVLNELFMLQPFCEKLTQDGWHVIFDPDTEAVLENHRRWSIPLVVENLNFIDRRTGEAGQLFGYQNFSLNRALERATARARDDRFFFYGWGTGTGKTLAAAAGAQELFNRDQIDVVMAFTLAHMRINYARFFTGATKLSAKVVGGDKPQRRKAYAAGYDVLVNNYAKLRFDKDLMAAHLEGKRVLWVLDEVQELTTGGRKNSWRQGLDELVKGKDIVWPMTASAVEETPMKYRDIFELSSGSKPNPLGSAEDFKNRYIRSEHRRPATARHGGTFWIIDRKWNKGRLHEVRHRVGHCTQNARKTDPGVRENFKGLTCEKVPVQLCGEQRVIYDWVVADAERAYREEESTIPHYNALRYVCNNPAALWITSESFCHEVAARFEVPRASVAANAVKLEILGDQLEAIRDEGDKALVFTKWTNLGTNLISQYLTKRKIAHVTHTGAMSERAAQQAQDDFKAREDLPVFLSSDAGSHGLNMPEARYVVSYECPYSYDTLHQRNDRVDRADSHLEGYTAYVYVAEDTLEERIWEVMDERRKVAEATTGATETLSYGDLAEDDEDDHPRTRAWLLFGEAA